MRIAQVSPLYERVPPRQYGGTERIVSYLTEELVALGHEVTLFASGDSITSAHLVSLCRTSLRQDESVRDPMVWHMMMLEQVYAAANLFDVIHFHLDYLPFSMARRMALSHLTTLHGRLDYSDLVPLFRMFPEMPVSSISSAQRKPLPWLNWQGTIHHGLPRNLYRSTLARGKYLAFLGRVSPEKGLDRAIEISERVGIPLRIAAKVDKADREYFQEVIRPLLQRARYSEFIGEIDDRDKQAFLGDAIALLFPVDWPEPFGIVMIEAMACGTPVIAWERGSVPEVIDEGVTGLIVRDLDEAVGAVERVGLLSRDRCRETFERRFDARRMAQDYVRTYESLLHKNAGEPASERRMFGRHHPAEGPVLCPGNIVAG